MMQELDPKVDRFNGLWKPDETPKGDLEEDLDLLPEFCNYTDDGCEVAEHCLECPLPRCKLETGKASAKRLDRNEEILRLYEEKWGIPELAARYQVNERTIYRIVKKNMEKRKEQRKLIKIKVFGKGRLAREKRLQMKRNMKRRQRRGLN